MPPARKRVNERQERLERQRRDRAAAVTLRVAYPGVEKLRFELSFAGEPRPPALQTHELYPAARAYFEFPCPYADCDGTFDLSGAVKATVEQSKADATGELECLGERALEGATRRLCGLKLLYRISVSYQRASKGKLP